MDKFYNKYLCSIFVQVLISLFTISILSCSMFEPATVSSSVSFTFSGDFMNTIHGKRGRSIEDLNTENLYVEISLLGSHNDTKSSKLSEGTIITFSDIPVNSKVYAKAEIYELDNNEKILSYSGKSDEITVKDGENILNLIMKKVFTLTLNQNVAGTAGEMTELRGFTITLPRGTFTREGFELYEWNTAADGSGTSYEAGSEIHLTEDTILYIIWAANLHETVTYLDSGTDGTAGTTASYVYFGDYPSTVKASSVTVDETKTKTIGGFTYYLGSDSYWYAKCTENAYASNYKYSDGTTVGQESTNIKYFRVEPIKWQILTDSYNGKKLLFAENILTAKHYVEESKCTLTESKSYANSEIRAWLNDEEGFLGSAFTSSAQALIATTNVDNSAESTNPASNPSFYNNGVNEYICDNTDDKIFLLSVKEVTNSDYGFDPNASTNSGNTRVRAATDWAKANHANTWYFLRSPSWQDDDNKTDGQQVFDVLDSGLLNYGFVKRDFAGTVPALCID